MREIVALIAVYGNPQPAGSKRAFVVNGRASVADANPRSRAWKDRVAQAAGEQYGGELLEGPLMVEFRFFQPRPRSHYGSGRNASKLKPSAPEWPITRPDASKLVRAAEDACTGVLWRDDAQLVAQEAFKFYGEPARCEIAVYRMGNVAAPEAAHEELIA